jgi:ribose transport system permease protein
MKLTLEWRMFLLTAALVVALSFASPYFLTSRNLLNILDQSVVVGIVSVGQTLVILVGGIDLSVGSIVGVTGVVFAVAARQYGFVPGIAAALFAGALAGLINGLIVQKGKVAPFIVTLGMLSVARSLSYILSGARSITDLPEELPSLAQAAVAGVPVNVVFLGLLYVLAIAYLSRTTGGRTIYAIGSNAEAARVAGLSVRFYGVVVYVISGVLCACAALFLAGRIRSVDPTSGTGLELDTIAAVVIGGASLFGGKGSMIGTLFGVFIMVCIRNGLNLLGIDPYWQGTVIGTIIVVAVLLERALSSRRS